MENDPTEKENQSLTKAALKSGNSKSDLTNKNPTFQGPAVILPQNIHTNKKNDDDSSFEAKVSPPQRDQNVQEQDSLNLSEDIAHLTGSAIP